MTRRTAEKQSTAESAADARAMARVRRAVRARLLPWFRAHRRALPWRTRRTPWRVLVAEIMLQQTRADQAAPYYRSFLKAFPTVRSLAAAPLSAVLKQWEGLGYYRRARHLHRLAQAVAARPRGRFPDTPEAWAALPGIGPYTLAAVGSLAYGWPLAVVDGNVVRVLSRIFAQADREPARHRARAQALLWPGAAGECNEAWMELGALVCLPRRPRCEACPLRACCTACAEGRPEAYPPARPRKTPPHYVVGAAVTFNARGEVLVARRKADAMLGGLWEFPGGKVEPGETLPECIVREIREELGCGVAVEAPLMTVRHAYSHFSIELHAHRCRLTRGRPRPIHCAAVAWRPVARLRELAFSRADLHIVDRLWRDAGLPEDQVFGQTRRLRMSHGSAPASRPASARSSSGRSSRPTDS